MGNIQPISYSAKSNDRALPILQQKANELHVPKNVFKIEEDPSRSGYSIITFDLDENKAFTGIWVATMEQAWATLYHPTTSKFYFSSDGKTLDTSKLEAYFNANTSNDPLENLYHSAKTYINSTEPAEAASDKPAGDEEVSTIPTELQNIPADNLILKFYLENNANIKSLVERANSILEKTESLKDGNAPKRKIENAISDLNSLRKSLIYYRDRLALNTNFIKWYDSKEDLNNDNKEFLRDEYLRITGELGSKILELEARMAELSEKAETPAPIADRVTLLVQPGQALYGIEEDENGFFDQFANKVRAQAELLDTSQAHLHASNALVGKKGHKAAKAEAATALQADKDKIDDYRTRFILPGPDRTHSTWGDLTPDQQAAIEEEYNNMAVVLEGQSQALEKQIEKLNTPETTEESADLDAQPTRAERRQEKARKKAEEKAEASRVADAGEESGLEDMGLPEVLVPYSSHRFVTPLPGVLQRVDLLVANTDKLIKRIRAEEDADDFVFDDSVEKDEIENERTDKLAIVDARLKAVDEQWKALETQRKYLDNTKQGLENLEPIDWGSMASKTDAQDAVIGFYKKQISKITKKQNELKNDLEPDLKAIRRQIDDDADNASTASHASGSTGATTSTGSSSTSSSSTVTSATLGGATTTTTVKLTADPNPVTAGNKVTVRFSTDVDPDTLSLTAGIVGKPTQALEIKPESGNNYIAQFDVPNDTKEGEIKFSLTSEDLKTTGSLKITVKAAPATASAPTAKTIGSLEITAKPSKAKPGQTVELTIKAFGSDNKRLADAQKDLDVKVKFADGYTSSLSSRVTEAGNGKYKVSYTIPGDAEGNITFQASSKTSPSIKETTQVNLITTTASELKEKPEETPGRLEISVNKQTVQPGEEVTVTLTLKNKVGNSDNMGGYSPNITIGSKPAEVTDNEDGTYTATYTIPNTTTDGTTLAVSGSIPTAGLTPATANITVSLPTPTTAPDQFFGFNSILGANVTANTKLTPLTKRLNAEIRAQWVDAGSLSEIEKIKKQAELATKIVDIIGNASDIDSKTKSAYFAQATLELDDIYQKIDKGVISLSKKQANVGREKIDKVNQLLELENAKKDISDAKYRIKKYTKPATYTERGNSITSPIARGYDLLVQNSNDATVAELLELHFSFSTKAKTLTELKTAYSIFQAKITKMTTSELTGVSASQRDSVLLELRKETKQTLDTINNKLKPKEVDTSGVD